MELAKAELAEKGKQAGIGAGLFGGAGVFGVYALGSLTAAAIAALGLSMDTWLTALIVAVIWAAVAGVMACSAGPACRRAPRRSPSRASRA
jgi:nitrate/nitrite transporter NarK